MLQIHHVGHHFSAYAQATASEICFHSVLNDDIDGRHLPLLHSLSDTTGGNRAFVLSASRTILSFAFTGAEELEKVRLRDL